ncbi:hypothetical protein B0H34DRAFT_710644 [Crassisporium funariophilum]|nr:hypothetical protein B0H34DRAFT_710644 [Crassisporium funariophilum]
MSFSPPIHRLSHGSSGYSLSNNSSLPIPNFSAARHQEELINAYEAEEERIINVLSRKLEKLREDKIELENTHEAESEAHVNRLSRELSALRSAHQQLQAQQQSQAQSQSQQPMHVPGPSTSNGASPSVSPDTRLGFRAFMSPAQSRLDPREPTAEIMLEAMRRENEQLRNRLVDTERDYIRISRLNEIYREELIDHRRRLGLSVDNLIGMSSSDPYSQPTHRRSSSASSGQSFYSNTSSPNTNTSVFHIPSSSYVPRHHIPTFSHANHASHNTHNTHSQTHGVPIPRPPSQIHRPKNNISSESNTPLSHSPSSASADSLYPFSPVASSSTSPSFANPASFVSVSTNITSPPSSGSFNNNGGMGMGYSFSTSSRGLSYPSVPPPSLSSSFGSPTVGMFQGRDHSMSPVEPLSRRNSNAAANGNVGITRRGSIDRSRVAETGSLRNIGGAGSRRASFDRGVGGRVAETGTLLGRRSRAGSHSHTSHGQMPETVDEAEDSVVGMELEEVSTVGTLDSETAPAKSR